MKIYFVSFSTFVFVCFLFFFHQDYWASLRNLVLSRRELERSCTIGVENNRGKLSIENVLIRNTYLSLSVSMRSRNSYWIEKL